MARWPIPSRCIAMAVAGAIMLPIAICLVLGVASLLSAMGDSSGGGAMRWIALGLGIVWALDLIVLVLALSINALGESNYGEANGSEVDEKQT